MFLSSLSIWLHYKSTSGEIRVMACCDQACLKEACKRETEDLATCESFEGPEVINLGSFKCSWFPRLRVREEGESGCPSFSSIILHWEGSGVPRPAGGAVPSLWRKLENSHRVERLFTSLWRLSLQSLHIIFMSKSYVWEVFSPSWLIRYAMQSNMKLKNE